MPTDLLVRHLATDHRTLNLYLQGSVPDMSEVISNLFLAERNLDYTLPDHYYVNLAKLRFEGCKSLREVLCRCFSTLTEHKVDWNDNHLHIPISKFNEWHNLITRFPPLPLIAFAILQRAGSPLQFKEGFASYTRQYITPNLGSTALIGPNHCILKALVDKPGLYDLHQHLNGTTEADWVWLLALERPDAVYNEISQSYDKYSIVREQFSATEPGLIPRNVFDRLCIATELRVSIIEHLFAVSLTADKLNGILSAGSLPLSRFNSSITFHGHPLNKYINEVAHLDLLPIEGLLHILALSHIVDGASSSFVHAYHIYLLLQGAFCQLIVQQHEQFGFDQFQRITENNFRSDAEKDYKRRFKQILGNGGCCVAFVEGRFAPKERKNPNRDLISKILTGYAHHCEKDGFDYDLGVPAEGTPLLRLVAHFIKKADTTKRSKETLTVRHHSLRTSLERQGRALLSLWHEDPLVKHFLVGIDAAANELHAPPEVFAPLYRLFRRNGFVNFTFHVGEDFVHLLSGLRRIHEAVEFLGLCSGNRIGHATAAGIGPEFWLNAVSNLVTLPRTEWLDNLVFAYDLLKVLPDGKPHLNKIETEIASHVLKVYGVPVQIDVLIGAWRLRHLDPLLACVGGRLRSDSLLIDSDEWDMIDNARDVMSPAFDMFCKYQMLDSVIDDAMIQVDNSVFDVELLSMLQQRLLTILTDKKIADL